MSEDLNQDRIERLLALNLIEGKKDIDAIKLLYLVGYNSTEIGQFVGMSPSTVRNKISNLRDRGEIDA